MPQLLVSVRSVEEAARALAGGADVIDVKEPQLGSLGRADDSVITAVVDFVAGRRPVSAALGELIDENPATSCQHLQDLSFVKWGLAGCGRGSPWPTLLKNLAKTLSATCQFVHVAYVDWQCAQAPPLDDVIDLACRAPGSVLLLDTHCKSASSLGRRPTLLDWLPLEQVHAVCERCREAQIRVALAGSIGVPEVKLLLPARPTWFAVRGAVCDGDNRDGMVQESRVRELARLLQE
jgi:uncharacterized protein (UPF0264 family)